MEASNAREHVGRLSPSAIRILFMVLLPLMMCGCYLSHLAGGQMRVICSSIPIEQALADKTLSEADKKKLRFVQEVKVFAESALHLKPTCNFTKYLPGPKKPTTYVVTAAHKRHLTSVTWWFPIVGRVSYKGFFDHAKALEEQKRLEAHGYDAHMHPSGAFSTLGWFCDPVIPTMLEKNDDDLVELVIHELTHSTLFLRGETQFNESLASFVAKKGSEQFLRGKRGAMSKNRNGPNWFAERESLRVFFHRLAANLRNLYAKGQDVDGGREKMFAAARVKLGVLCKTFREQPKSCAKDAPLNNAVVIENLSYGSFAPFEKLFADVGGNWQAFFAELRRRHKK